MLVRLLGRVDVTGAAGAPPIEGERRLSVLACLALQVGELVTVDRIVDAVWGDRPPATARNTIQSHVTYLRRATEAPDAFVNRSGGYVLMLEPPGTDVALVDGLLARAARTEVPAERLDLLQEALGWWRGPSLLGVGESDYLARHAWVLDDRRLSTFERAYADRLRLGQHAEVIEALRVEVVTRPERERLVQLLMVALYRDGRAPEALRAYEDLVRVLADDLDAEPSPVLRRTMARVRSHDPELLVPAALSRREAPAAKSAMNTPGSNSGSVNIVPLHRPSEQGRRDRQGPRWMRVAAVAARTPIVGREGDLEAAEQLLTHARLLSVVGLGGVGKTRLAAELVRRAFAAGRRCHVADVGSVGDAVQALATALSLEPDPGAELLDAVVAALPDVPSLVVLDSCEADLDGAGRLASAVADQLPQTTVVVTSTEPLHVDVEECLILQPLGVPAPGGDPLLSPAVQLVVTRAQASDPGFLPDAEALAVLAEICRRVEGLPLALEIIAPRLRSMTPSEILDAVTTRLLVWQDQRRDISPHHRSIGSLMAWSYALLDDAEAVALDRLAMLVGGAWLEEATALCDDDPVRGEALLLRLIERSLVNRHEVEGRSRIVMHGLVRAYVHRRLLDDPARAVDCAGRHPRWVSGVIEEWYARQHGTDELRLMRARRLDDGNTTAALEWAHEHDPELLAGLVARLWWYWYRTGQAAAGLGWARRALRLPGVALETESRVLAAAGYLAWLVDAYDDARDLADRALASSAATLRTQAFAHGVVARAVGDSGDFVEAASRSRRSIECYEQAGDRWGVAWSSRLLATALFWGGDVEASEEPCDVALAEFEAFGDGWGVAGTLELKARIEQSRGHVEAALELGEDALAANRDCGDTSGERYALQQLADANWELGRVDRAERLARASLDLSTEHGYRVGALQAVQLLEDVHRARGEDDGAERLAHEAQRMVARVGAAAAEVSLGIAAARRAAAIPAPGRG